MAHSWRAHKEGLRHIVVSETEDVVVSAGKGMAAGREGDVLRVWDLATSSAGALPTWLCLSGILRSRQSQVFIAEHCTLPTEKHRVSYNQYQIKGKLLSLPLTSLRLPSLGTRTDDQWSS